MILYSPTRNNCHAIEAKMPDGVVRRFDSVKTCARELGIKYHILREHIRADIDYEGITFRYT